MRLHLDTAAGRALDWLLLALLALAVSSLPLVLAVRLLGALAR